MTDVTHLPERSRFVVEQDGHAAVLTYELDDEGPGSRTVVSFLHTVVPAELGGRGVGSRLADSGVRWAREQGHELDAVCSFVRGWLERHPEALQG
jgi:uncharacterized protein